MIPLSECIFLIDPCRQVFGWNVLGTSYWLNEGHVLMRNHYQNRCFTHLDFWFVGISMYCAAIISTWENRSHTIFFCSSVFLLNTCCSHLLLQPVTWSEQYNISYCRPWLMLQKLQLGTYRCFHHQAVEDRTSTLIVVLKRKREWLNRVRTTTPWMQRWTRLC